MVTATTPRTLLGSLRREGGGGSCVRTSGRSAPPTRSVRVTRREVACAGGCSAWDHTRPDARTVALQRLKHALPTQRVSFFALLQTQASVLPGPFSHAHKRVDRTHAQVDVAYQGSEFAGWAFQANRRTVQGTLEVGVIRGVDG